MVSRTGAQLIDDAVETRDTLIPLAGVVNRYEAQLLSGLKFIHWMTWKLSVFTNWCKDRVSQRGGMAGNLRGVDVWFDGHQMKP